MKLDQTFRHMKAMPVSVELKTIEALLAKAPAPKVVKINPGKFLFGSILVATVLGIGYLTMPGSKQSAQQLSLPLSLDRVEKNPEFKEELLLIPFADDDLEEKNSIAQKVKEKQEVENKKPKPDGLDEKAALTDISVSKDVTEGKNLIEKEFVIYSTDPVQLVSMITGQARESNVRVSRNVLRYKDDEFKKLVLDFAVPIARKDSEDCSWREFLHLKLEGISNLKYGWTQDEELQISEFWYSINDGEVTEIEDVYTGNNETKVKIRR